MLAMCLLIPLFLQLAGSATAVESSPPPTKVKVTSLPGVVAPPHADPLPNEMYTGYIDAGTPPNGEGKMYFHYWCIMSARNASMDPVLFWYNGGPGASSLFGLLQEFGPLLLNMNSYDAEYKRTGIPTPQANTWAWTQTHTVCALDSPPPMGLSFCTPAGPGGSPTSCGSWKDTAVFAANHAAHRAFFETVFPELKPNPMYFVGESYAGIYVPGFAEAMMDDPVPGLNFQGYMVGDGWPGCKQMPGKSVSWCVNLDNVGKFEYPNAMPGPYWDLELFHGLSQMSHELYTKIHAICSEAELRGEQMPLSEDCSAQVSRMGEEIGKFDPYNIFNACPSDMSFANKYGANQAARARGQPFPISNTPLTPVSPGAGDGGVGSQCLGNSMSEWLLRSETLSAIGAPQDSNFINLDNGHGFNYTTDRSFVGDIYEKAIRSGKHVLIYEGDVDACGLSTLPLEDIMVPLFDGVINRTQNWRPWMLSSKILGGHTMEWGNGRVKFASLRGAGHMSPLNRPRASYEMINEFTANSLPHAVVSDQTIVI